MSETAETTQPSPPRRRAAAWIVLVLVFGAIGVAIWAWAPWRASPAQPADQRASAPAEPAAATTTPAAVVSEVEVLHDRLEDLARINRTLREQVLSLTQRLSLVEEAIDNARRGEAPGIDGLRLEEANWLLGLAEQRLALLGDRRGALAALDLADAQLREVAEIEVARVRQALALERAALRAGGFGIDVPAVLGRLDQLAAAVDNWPDKPPDALALPADAGWTARVLAGLDRYFRVRRIAGDERAPAGPLARERLLLELSRSRWLLLRGDWPATAQALATVRRLVATAFPTEDAAVAAGLSTLDELIALPWHAEPPRLGEARSELARLRAAAAGAAGDPPATSAPGMSDAQPTAAPAADLLPSAPPEAMAAPASTAPLPEDDDALDP